MPQLQVVNLTPRPRTEPTNLERTLDAFTNRYQENEQTKKDTDALSDIYSKYKSERQSIDDLAMNIQTDRRLGPTARVNALNQANEMKKTNTLLQKEAVKNQRVEQKAIAKQKEADEKLATNRAYLTQLEKQRDLEAGSLSQYENNPLLADKLTKQSKPTQASQPIAPTQLDAIKKTRALPEFVNASPSRKYQLLTENGVSKENAKAEADIAAEENKAKNKREEVLAGEQAKADASFFADQMAKVPQIVEKQRVLEQANVLNEEGVTGGNWDRAMQKAGLLQFTSQGFREYASLAKESVKNANIRAIVGSQMSQMEFQFFRDATINEAFSKEANRRLINKELLAGRYEKLYTDITADLVRQNGGTLPPNFQSEVNEQFAKQSKKISDEVKEQAIEFDAIQNVPNGFVLMYDKKRKPLHVPANQVQKYSELGASLK